MDHEEDLDKVGTCHPRTKFPTSPLVFTTHCLVKPVRICDRFSYKKEWFEDLLMAIPINKVQNGAKTH